MVHTGSIRYLLTLTLAALACGLTSPATAAPTIVPVTQTAPSLTINQLKNAQYKLGARDDHAVVQLTDGKYQQGTDATTLDYASVVMSDFASFGDLNHDGVNEGAVVVYENYGGTGDFGFLVLYSNQNGGPVFVNSVMIDDRPQINRVAFQGDEVFLDATIHGPQDPGCCPVLPTTQQYRLIGSSLRLSKYTTNTPAGDKRELFINSPVDGTQVNGSVQVQGNVSIAPFENTLSFAVYNENYAQLTTGAINVAAPDLGKPGTFDATIDLSMVPPGSKIFLQIEDVSAADGSILAMDLVPLVVK